MWVWGYVWKTTKRPVVAKHTHTPKHTHTWRDDKATKFDDLG